MITTNSFHINPILTRREKEIMAFIATGNANKQIAAALFISQETVKKHVQNIFQKLGAHNKIQAINKFVSLHSTEKFSSN